MSIFTAAPPLSKTVIPFEKTGQFRKIYIHYTSGSPAQKAALKAFYRFEPSLEGIGQMIEARARFPQENRDALADVLLDQYRQAGVLTPDRAATIDELRNPNTFTITTGHQLSIGLGPQYVAFKILTVIKLCRLAKERYPQYDFVPMMWLSGEDHDIDEISAVRVNGRDHAWNAPGSGPAGYLSTKGLGELLLDGAGEMRPMIERYGSYATLADAQLYLTDALFGDLGIIGLNASDARLKRFAIPLFTKELAEGFSHDLIENEGKKLVELGYHAQIVTRPINLFLIEPGRRDRFELGEDGRYKAGNEHFSKEELLALLDSNPEKFSPNVATRPMYQEVILPNLAYIGGPAEVAYWLMLKPAFEAAGVGLPLIWPRQNMLVAPAQSLEAWQEAGFGLEDLFRGWDHSRKAFYLRQAGRPDLTQQHLAWSSMFGSLKNEARKLDEKAAHSIAADEARLEKAREKIFRKVEKAFERQFEPEVRKLEKVRDFFLPGNTLQERVESFLTLYLRNPAIARQLLEAMDPQTSALLFLEEANA